MSGLNPVQLVSEKYAACTNGDTTKARYPATGRIKKTTKKLIRSKVRFRRRQRAEASTLTPVDLTPLAVAGVVPRAVTPPAPS